MIMDVSFEMILTLVIIPAITVIAAIIKILWSKNESHVQNTIKLWKECEADRRETSVAILKLTKEVAKLGGYEKGVQALAETLMQEVGHHSHNEEWNGVNRRSLR